MSIYRTQQSNKSARCISLARFRTGWLLDLERWEYRGDAQNIVESSGRCLAIAIGLARVAGKDVFYQPFGSREMAVGENDFAIHDRQQTSRWGHLRRWNRQDILGEHGEVGGKPGASRRLRRSSPSAYAPPATPVATEALALPDRPPIAVRPFTNMSGDPARE